MPVTSTQDFSFKLVANGTQLDLFKDEAILLSDNVTGLFDLGILPSDFTRQITLPGTKINNAFFEHVYDISIESPFLFETNVKVPCFFDFDSIYLADGYLQLNKVNVIANKFIDSYEVTIYGGLSSFARDINRSYLTDLTSSLAQYNHTASLQNITASWEGNLFGGDIVYPMAEYGQKLIFNPALNQFGIDSPNGALTVQDFKPAIRVKKVWDAIFEEFGYTYSSSFFGEPFIDDIYLLCNNKLRYPIFENIDLETYGLFKTAPLRGLGQTQLVLDTGSLILLPWFNIEENPGGNLNSQLQYSLDFPSKLRGELKLNFEMDASGSGNGAPLFNLVVASGSTSSSVDLPGINNLMVDVFNYNETQTRTQKFTVDTEFQTPLLPAGNDYRFYIRYFVTGSNNFTVTLNPGGDTNSYLQIKKVNQGGDREVMNIADNMPFGTSGIKLIDFITSVQKKFNLVIYPSKTKQREFIVEPFVNWYKRGKVKDFNKFINLDDMIEVIPANNLAVNELNFGDTLDKDYISQQFNDEANREFGKTYYIDTQNFFSQGKFEVQSGFASTPLTYLTGTGLSGSAASTLAGFASYAESRIGAGLTGIISANSSLTNVAESVTIATSSIAVIFPGGSASNIDRDPDSGFRNRRVYAGNTVVFGVGGTGPNSGSYLFQKETDSGLEQLASGSFGGFFFLYEYTITNNDCTSSVLNFISTGSMRV